IETKSLENLQSGPFASPVESGHVNGAGLSFQTSKAGVPLSTCHNARLALGALGIVCRFDVFHRKMVLSDQDGNGGMLQRYAGELTDPAVHVLRVAIEQTYGFDPTAQHVRDAAEQLCLANHFDPVVDYLAAVEWDGRERAAHWMVDYLG